MTDEPTQTFTNVWGALADTPEEAANLRLRGDLAMAIREAVEHWGQTRAQAARRLGVTQPRLNDLLRGRLDRFSLDALIALAGRAGVAVELRIGLAAA